MTINEQLGRILGGTQQFTARQKIDAISRSSSKEIIKEFKKLKPKHANTLDERNACKRKVQKEKIKINQK